MDTPPTVAQSMRNVRARQDHTLAGRLSDLLRMQHGLDYDGIVRIYAKANDLDQRTAGEEWEDMMQEAEYHST